MVQKLMYAVAEIFNYVITHFISKFLSNRSKIYFDVSQKAVAELILLAIYFYLHTVTSLRQ